MLAADPGAHPNPAKAADGRRLHGLALSEDTAPVVRRIFAEFLGGSGLFAIAEGLTRDDVRSPSGQDPARNRRRSGIARGRGPTQHVPHRSRHAYQLRSRLHCGCCLRRMQGEWLHGAAYYRCRFPNEYAAQTSQP